MLLSISRSQRGRDYDRVGMDILWFCHYVGESCQQYLFLGMGEVLMIAIPEKLLGVSSLEAYLPPDAQISQPLTQWVGLQWTHQADVQR